MTSNSSIIIIGSPLKVTTYAELMKKEGVKVIVVESYQGALEEAERTKPGAIVMIVPVYITSVIEFAEKIRKSEALKDTPLVYIGSDVIESAYSKILHNLGVKTLTLGPVPVEEMVRFILKTIPS